MDSKKMCDMLCGVGDTSKYLDLSLLLIRLSVAATFIFHGWQKIGAPDQFIGFFASLGFGAMMFYLVAYVELLGGIALALGVATRFVGGLFAIIMIVAIWTVHLKAGFNSMSGGYEFQLLLLICSVSIALVGPGKFSWMMPCHKDKMMKM